LAQLYASVLLFSARALSTHANLSGTSMLDDPDMAADRDAVVSPKYDQVF
jgi:hypothetical protein